MVQSNKIVFDFYIKKYYVFIKIKINYQPIEHNNYMKCKIKDVIKIKIYL